MGVSLGIVSIKGGVGKTTIASSIAADLANHCKKKVLLIDANYSAPNVGLHMDIIEPEHTIHEVLAGKTRISSAIHKKYGVDVIPGSYIYDRPVNVLKLKDRIRRIKDSYDFVLIDSSPNLNEEALSAIFASDYLFLVSTPDYPTLSCSLRLARFVRQHGAYIAGVILNKTKDTRYELSIREIEETTGIPVVAKIPDEKIHKKALFFRVPLVLYKKNSKFSKEIKGLNEVLTGMPHKKSVFESLLSLPLRREEINRALLKEYFYSKNLFNKNGKRMYFL